MIRVDPDELQLASLRIGEIAARMEELARETLDVASAAPSYDGQFGPKVEAIAQEGHAYLIKQASQLKELSERLARIAEAFDEADRESLAGFESLAASFGATLLRFEHLLHAELPEEPEPPPDEDEEQSWLDRLADQIANPEFFFDLITDPFVAEWMTTIKNAPPFTVVLPMLKGFGMDDLAGPISRTVDTSFWIRTFGRTIGDAGAGPLFLVGLGISVAPELHANVKEHAPWNEFAADLTVDTGIYSASELAGWAGLLGGSSVGGPAVGVPAKLGLDLLTGAGLEFLANQHGWRGNLAGFLGQAPAGVSLWLTSAIDESLKLEIPPIPTPSQFHSATGTPVPTWMLVEGSVINPVPSTASPTPAPQITPQPTPPPGGDDG